MAVSQTLQRLNSTFTDSERKMPVLFVGHGSPMNAIEDNEFSRAWMEAGKALPKPNAILSISAHWETSGALVTSMERPKTIYDFYGFPESLYEVKYPASGSPKLARLIQDTAHKTQVGFDQSWGLDHGTWIVLRRMFPKADIPVVQLSLDRSKPPELHYALGKELRSLRSKGILIVGSGNIVHNLGMMTWQSKAYDWALEFDETVKQCILSGNHASIIRYQDLGQAAHLSIPTNEHYLPLLYVLALQDKQEQVRFFAEGVTFGSVSMRSLWIE